MDDVTALPILLVVHDERHRGGSCEDGCIACRREQRSALPKTNIADAKLYRTGGAVLRRERSILADPQEEIKRHNDQVGCSRLAGRGGGVVTCGSRNAYNMYG
jgi:hypothetical protein